MSTAPGSTHESALDQATARQRQAADPSFSVWVSANAGTGKTRVLIDRISRLMLAGVRSERILCLTYTKAAAAEMENRLSERLGAWATMDDAEISAELLVLNGTPAQTSDIHRARQLFAETLETPGGLKIRTIHSFCESLLGRFPVEAQIVPHAAVMDERAAAELFSEARQLIYTQAFHDDASPLAIALNAMAGLVDEDGFEDLMREVLYKRQRLMERVDQVGFATTNAAPQIQPLDRGCEALSPASQKTETTAARRWRWRAFQRIVDLLQRLDSCALVCICYKVRPFEVCLISGHRR